MSLLKMRLLLSALTVFMLLSCAGEDHNKTKIKKYDGSWESLQTMDVPEWFDDGKIGIFIHWDPRLYVFLRSKIFSTTSLGV